MIKTYTIPSDKLFDDLVEIDVDKITPDRSDLDADTVLDAMHAIAKEEIGEDGYAEDLADVWGDVHGPYRHELLAPRQYAYFLGVRSPLHGHDGYLAGKSAKRISCR